MSNSEKFRTDGRLTEYPGVTQSMRTSIDRADAIVTEIRVERHRQIMAEGWTPEHDDGHRQGEMAMAAASYTIDRGLYRDPRGDGEPPSLWPWSREWWKPKDRRRDLIRAAALIAAEIERLDRARASGGGR